MSNSDMVTDKEGVLKRRCKHITIKGPLGSSYADYRDSGKQSLGAGEEASLLSRKGMKKSSITVLTTGLGALEAGRNVLSTVGSVVTADVAKLFLAGEEEPMEKKQEVDSTKRTIGNRAFRPIRYGDHIMLSAEISSSNDQEDLQRGILHADAMISKRALLYLFTDPSDLDLVQFCVFQICKPGDAGNSSVGGVLHYGKPFVLKCKLFSNALLCHELNKHADIEKNFGRVGMILSETDECVMTMMPKFQSRAKDSVYYGDDILISSHQKGYFMHAGGMNAAASVGLEGHAYGCKTELDVNWARLRDIESGACLWQVAEYATGDKNSADFLSSGTAIRLYQPELNSYLVANSSSSPAHVFGAGSNGQAYRRHNSVAVGGDSAVLEIDPPVFACNYRNGLGETHGFHEDVMGHSIFVIEKSHPMIGGAIEWGEPVRFRHVGTNSYLSVNRAPLAGDKKKLFTVPFCAALCRLIDASDETTRHQFLHDTVFFLESATRVSADEKKIRIPVSNLCIKHVYRQSEYETKTSSKDKDESAVNLPYFMRIHRRVENEVRKLRSDLFDGKATDAVIETIFSFGDDSVLKIPQYPEIIHSANDDGSEVERAQRLSELAENYTTVSKVAQFLDDVNDADVIQFVVVPPSDVTSTSVALTITKILHEFEASLVIMAEKMKAGVKYHIKSDVVFLMHTLLDTLTIYSSTDEAEKDLNRVRETEQQSSALETQYDRQVAVRRQQQQIVDMGLLDRLFWLFRSPVYLDISWPVIYKNATLLSIFKKIKLLISSVCRNNSVVQEYVAHSCYLGSRAKVTDDDVQTLQGGEGGSVGYASEIFSHLHIDEEDASYMLEAALLCNRDLLSALFDEDVIETIVGLIELKGAKPSLLRLLGGMANSGSIPMFPNQRLLMDLLYSLRDDQRYILNRRRMLMETSSTIEGRSILYGRDCSEQLTLQQNNVCILWYGSDESDSGHDVAALFKSAKTMDMTSFGYNETQIHMSDELKEYFVRLDCAEEHRDWISLQTIAWCIDPSNCFEFNKPGTYSKTVWAERETQLRKSPQKFEKFKMMRKVVLYYGAILDFFERMTANRSSDSVKYLENQYSPELLFSGVGNEDLPLYFRYRFGALLRNMFIDRFPHEDLNLPDLVRVPERIKDVHSFDSALPTYMCRMKPSLNSNGEIFFKCNGERYQFIQDASPTKFKILQCIIGQYFLGSKFALHVGPDHLLGSLAPSSPSSRLGGSEVDSYRFSSLLLEIAHLLVRRGFYCTEGLLLQAIHISYGVLISHVYTELVKVNDSPLHDVVAAGKNVDRGRSGPYEALPTEESPTDDIPQSATTAVGIEMTQPLAASSSIANNAIYPGYLLHKVKDKISDKLSYLTAGEQQTQALAPGRKVLIKSDALSKLCARHEKAIAEESQAVAMDKKNSDMKLITVFENQRHAFTWQPVLSAHRDRFQCEDRDVKELFRSVTTPEESPRHEGGLPDELWKWVENEEWRVNPNAGGGVVSLDPDGWVYAFAWPADRTGFSPSVGSNHFVRRRKWERTRVLKSAAEIADLLYMKNFSEPVILAAFKDNLSSTGIINLREVYQRIKDISNRIEKKNRLLEASRVVDQDGGGDFGAEVLSDAERSQLLSSLSVKCVSEALGMLAYMYVISADTRITSFFSIVRQSVTSNTPLWMSHDSNDAEFQPDTLSLTPHGRQLVDRIFTGKLASLDCGRLSKGNFVDKVLCFVMFEDHAVCSLALDVLREHFQQARNFSDQLCSVIYCSGSEMYYKYLLMRSLVAITRSNLQLYWIREGACSLSHELVSLFDEMTACLQEGGSDQISLSMQDIARSMGTHTMALHTLKCDMEGLKTMSELQRKSSVPLWRSICRFLIVFIRDNPQNILLVGRSFVGGSFGIGVGFPGADSIAMLFNEMLCSHKKILDHIPAQLLYVSVYAELSERLYDIPSLSVYTDLLKSTLVNSDGTFEVWNQNFLTRIMLSKQNLHLALLYVDLEMSGPSRMSVSYMNPSLYHSADLGKGAAGVKTDHFYMQRKDLMRQFCELPPASQHMSSNIYCTKLVYYHAACVEMLALCAAGGNVSNAAKGAQLIPVDIVLAVLLEISSYQCFPILKAFSVFLVNIYIAVAALETNGDAVGTIDSSTTPDEALFEDPLLSQVILQFCSVISSLEPNEWIQCGEGEGVRNFIIGGAFYLFRAYFLVQVESVDLLRSELSVIVQQSITHLQSFPKDAFSSAERAKIYDLSHFVFGMPADESISKVAGVEGAAAPEHKNVFDIENPLKMGKSKKRDCKVAKPEMTSWGDSTMRFLELPQLVETCPHLSNLCKEELDSLAESMMKGYRSSRGLDEAESGDISVRDRYSEKEGGSIAGDGRGVKYTSGTAPLSSKSKSVKEGNNIARTNFSGMVSRLVKYAREEVDVLVSTNATNGASVNTLSERLKNIKRATSAMSGAEGTRFASDIGAGDGDDVSYEINRWLPDSDAVSKNIAFVFLILSRCIINVSESVVTEALNNERSAMPSSSGANELEDIQDIYASAMVASLIAEVISGCRYTSVLAAAIDLGVEFLANGNKKSQDYFLWHLKTIDPSEAAKFFGTFKNIMQYTANSYMQLRNGREKHLSGDVEPNGTVSQKLTALEAIRASKEMLGKLCVSQMLEILRLMNENHNFDVQNIMETQKGLGLKESSELLTAAVKLLDAYLPSTSAIHLLTDVDACIVLKIFEFLAETVQGPCPANQEILAQSSIPSIVQSLLEFTAHFELRSHTRSTKQHWRGKYGLHVDTLKKLRVGGLSLLVSLLEGRHPQANDTVFAMLCQSFNFSAIPGLLSGVVEERNKAQVYLRRKFESSSKIISVEAAILEEGFLLLSLGHQVAAYSQQVASDLVPVLPPPVKKSKYPTDAEFNEAERDRRITERIVKDVAFFKERLRSVEISWGGLGLFKFYFTMPNECHFLTEESKRTLIQDIDFGDEDRVKYFMNKTSSIHDDVSHQQTLQNHAAFILLMRFQDELDYATAALAISINFILIISLQKGYMSGESHPVYEPHSYRYGVQVLVIIQLIVLLYKLLQTSILSLPLIYKESVRVGEELTRAQAKGAVELGVGVRDLISSFGPFLAVSSVCFIVALLIHTRYSSLPTGIMALMIILLAKIFITSLGKFAKSSWHSKITGSSLLIAIARSMEHGELKYRVVCAAIGVLALNVDRPYFSSLMLLVIVKLSLTLQNVVRAVTLPRVALFLSSLLGLIMIFIFSIFAFYLFPNEFYNEDQYIDECSTLLLCLTTFLHGGLLSGGGIADHISGDLGHPPIYADSALYSSRVTYDVFFFVIIIVLLLNIIFGIIIDTFGKLREDAAEKKKLQNDYCFICGISREAFEAVTHDKKEENIRSGYNSAFLCHIKTDHNMWDYVFFLIYLLKKDQNNYFGIESYVVDKVKQDDVSWIPRGIALSIPDTHGEDQQATEERMMEQIKSIMEATQKIISAGVVEQTSRLQEENRGLQVQVSSALKSVTSMQETLDEIKTAQSSLEDVIKQITKRK